LRAGLDKKELRDQSCTIAALEGPKLHLTLRESIGSVQKYQSHLGIAESQILLNSDIYIVMKQVGLVTRLDLVHVFCSKLILRSAH
jgi:hypothetical protein